jgi:hypothetical protein
MSLKPLCFVLMPFGQKPDPAGGAAIDFDRIYTTALAPAIKDADMEPIRADEERTGGIIHKPMFERLLLCDYAVADLTTANANVFYELGVRHTARPATTLTIFAKNQPIPFDVNFLRSMPYDLGEKNAFGDTEAQALREAVSTKLKDLRALAIQQAPVDSPLFDLLKEWEPGNIARLKTDVFRQAVQLNEELKRRLAAIREKGKKKKARGEAIQELQSLRTELGALDAVEAGTAVDLMLSFRALEDWDGMIAVYSDMPEMLKRQILVREQVGFAYNRRAGKSKNLADRAEALRILTEVEAQQGPSSETCGLIGRIHKDNWTDAMKANDQLAATGHLKKSIEAYIRGFMADQRDAYPGINAITLLDIKGDEESLKLKKRLLPVVRFAVEQRLAGSEPDYWDHATMLELAVLNDEFELAAEHLADAVAVIRETWEPDTTANNLRMIERARVSRGGDTSLLVQIIEDLQARAR